MSQPAPALPAESVQRVPTSRVAVLASSQLIAGVGVASGLSVGGLLAEDLTGTSAFSGLPQTCIVFGSALAAVPLARFAGRSGRRPALTLGYTIAAVGATGAFASAALRSLPLLLLAALLVGGGLAAGLQARFAATDGVPDSRRGIVLSVVVWASSIGAILGPNLIGPGARLGERLGVRPLGGPWVFAIISLTIAAFAISLLLKDTRPVVRPERRHLKSTLASIWAHRDGRLGLVSMATGHAVMVGVMAMTSVHLHGHGSTLKFVGLVISAHVAGMYTLAPLFGWLTDKWGPVRVVALGGVVLLAGCGFAAASGWVDASSTGAMTHMQRGSHGIAEALATPGLVLIGFGWSAVTVAAATLISVLSHHGHASPTDVQGASDLVMGVAGASAGALSGVVLAGIGYTGLSLAGALLLVPLVVEVVRHRSSAAADIGGGDPEMASL